MTEQRKQEAEEAAKVAGYPKSHWHSYNIFITGYLAACEKCEGERDEFKQWCQENECFNAFVQYDKFIKFKTHNNEHGNKG